MLQIQYQIIQITNKSVSPQMLSSNTSHNKINKSTSQGKKPRVSKGNRSRLNISGKENVSISSQKPARLSNILYNQKSQNKPINQAIISSTESVNANSSNNLDNASLQDMIELLRQYEKVCLEKQDFSSAQEAKNKIEFLKAQQVLLRKQELENQDRQNIERISKQGEDEIRMFQEHWDQQLQELIEALKEVESNLIEQHEKQLEQIQQKLEKEEVPKVKFSSQILEIRKHLSNLIKVKNYKEAQIIKIKLQGLEKEETEKWIDKFQIKKQHKMESIIKKQQNELKALRVRLEGVFNEKLKERDQKFEILLKKNRKRRIESGKMSRERLKTKTALLNQSKSYMQSTMGPMGNSTYKF